jgi:hypothetical protein
MTSAQEAVVPQAPDVATKDDIRRSKEETMKKLEKLRKEQEAQFQKLHSSAMEREKARVEEQKHAEEKQRAREARQATETAIQTRRTQRILLIITFIAAGLGFTLVGAVVWRTLRGQRTNAEAAQLSPSTNQLKLKPNATLEEIERLAQKTGKNKFPYIEHLDIEDRDIHGWVELNPITNDWVFKFGSHQAKAKRRRQAALDHLEDLKNKVKAIS